MPGTTATLALPYPTLGDAADVEQAVKPLAQRLEVILASLGAVPIGARMGYCGAGDPTPIGGMVFLLADGRLVSRTTYVAFFATVGHSFNGGVDPGGSQVRLPDYRGRVAAGADNMGTAQGAAGRVAAITRGSSGGVAEVVLLESQIPLHDHLIGNVQIHGGDHAHVVMADSLTAATTGGAKLGVRQGSGSAMGLTESAPHAHTMSGDTANAGGGLAHSNLQPYQGENMIVRVA